MKRIITLKDLERRPRPIFHFEYKSEKSKAPKLPWYFKALGWLGVGVSGLMMLIIIMVFIAIGLWAIKYIWGAF